MKTRGWKLPAYPTCLRRTPDIRFVTELHYQGKPHLTMVAGLPSFGARK